MATLECTCQQNQQKYANQYASPQTGVFPCTGSSPQPCNCNCYSPNNCQQKNIINQPQTPKECTNANLPYSNPPITYVILQTDRAHYHPCTQTYSISPSNNVSVSSKDSESSVFTTIIRFVLTCACVLFFFMYLSGFCTTLLSIIYLFLSYGFYSCINFEYELIEKVYRLGICLIVMLVAFKIGKSLNKARRN